MKGRRVQKVLAAVLAVAMVLPMTAIPAKAEEAEEVTYKLYPNPQEMTYQDGSYILKKNVNVIYDEDIDDATKARLKETAGLKGLNVTESDAEKSGATNIYVGVYGSDGTVDDQIVDEYHVDTSLFDHTDSYFLKSDNNTIAVLGKDTDASFYGLTNAFYHHPECYDEATGQFGTGSQASYAIALFSGMAEEHEEQAVKALVEAVKKNGYHLTSGEVGLKQVFTVLAEAGYSDDVYHLFIFCAGWRRFGIFKS